MRRSALMITTDSGPRHFAAAFNTPVITLFGPTHIAWTRTYHPQAWHILHQVPCGPCQRPVCPEGHHRCMRDLSPETVFRAALRVRGDGAKRLRTASLGGVSHVGLAGDRSVGLCRTARSRCAREGADGPSHSENKVIVLGRTLSGNVAVGRLCRGRLDRRGHASRAHPADRARLRDPYGGTNAPCPRRRTLHAPISGRRFTF